MPYTRPELLEAFRTDHPELRNVRDNDLFAAIAQDHPDLAQGISELTPRPYTSPRYGPTDATGSQMAQDLSAEFVGGVGGAITDPILHPIETAKSIGNLVGTGGPSGRLKAIQGLVEPPARALATTGQNALALGRNLGVVHSSQFEIPTMGGKLPITVPPPAPESRTREAASTAGNIVGSMAIPEIGSEVTRIPAVSNAIKPITSRLAYAQPRPVLFRTPEGHLQNALKPELDTQGLIRAGSDLKAGEAKIGQPVKDIDTARAAASAQFKQELYPWRRAIIDPQRDVVIPGTRQGWIDAKMSAIPESIVAGTPDHTALVADIHANAPPADLTIGQLEKINTSLNSTNRAYHQSKLSGALSKLETVKGAGDVALEDWSRRAMADGMDTHGLAGAATLRNVNQRIGALIKIQDALDTVESTARTEATMPHVSRALQEAGQAVGSTIRKTIPGQTPMTVNENIANAMRRWKAKPASFSMTAPKNFIKPIEPPKGQLDLLQTSPAGGGAMAPPDLFGVEPTPYRWKPTMRETSTTQDLTAMKAEIENYLRTSNPPSATRKQWAADVADIQHEIYRRNQARSVGKSKP